MPRTGRIALPHYPHHLVHRGHNRRAVFRNDSDRIAYLETLKEFRGELHLKIYGYCLMTNHVHLIADPGEDPANLGRLMKRLAGRHTRRMNHFEQRSGTLWNGRFKCSSIETDRYLLACFDTSTAIPFARKSLQSPRNSAGRAIARRWDSRSAIGSTRIRAPQSWRALWRGARNVIANSSRRAKANSN